MQIDNFALTHHETCPAKYNLRIRHHWTPTQKSAPLSFGGVGQAGLAAWYSTGDLFKALEAVESAWTYQPPADEWRTLAKCLKVVKEYIDWYPKEPWTVVGLAEGNPIIEKSFTLSTGLYLPCSLSYLGKSMPDAEGVVVEDDRCPFFDPPEPEETTCPNCGRLCIWKGSSLPVFALGYFLLGGFRAGRPMVLAQARDLVHDSQMGFTYGIIETISSIILILTPPLAGVLFGIDPMIVYPLSIGLIAVSILISYRFAPRKVLTHA